MPKKILFILISLLLISPALVPVFSIFTAEETRVCGIDNNNYPSITEAEKSGIKVSYDFPCQSPRTENGLFEMTEKFEFTGMLLDFFIGKAATQLFIKNNFDQQEYLSFFDALEINNYLPGDQLKVNGILNKNTKVVSINNLENLSANNSEAVDCVLSQTNEPDKNFYCKDEDAIFIFNYDSNSRFVVGLTNPATTNDLEIGDLLRVRYTDDYKAKTIILKERNNTKYFKNHIFATEAKLISVDLKKKILNLELGIYPSSIYDINNKSNLINLEIQNNTRLIKKYFGKLNIENFKTGDNLYIIGKAKDDGTFEAIIIKNNSIWK